MSDRNTSDWLHILSGPTGIPDEVLLKYNGDTYQLMKDAADDTMFDFLEGYKVWQIYYNYEVEVRHLTPTSAELIWSKRLTTPSIAIKDLYQQCVQYYTSRNSVDDYLALTSRIASDYSKASKQSDTMKMYEIQLAENKNDEAYWMKYVMYCLEEKDQRLRKFGNNVFERMIRLNDQGQLNLSIESWTRYFTEANTGFKITASLIRHFPTSSQALQLIVKRFTSNILTLYEFRDDLQIMHPNDDRTQRVLEGILWRVNRIQPSASRILALSYVINQVFKWALEHSLTDVQRTCICTLSRFKLFDQISMIIPSFLHLDNDNGSLNVDDWLFILDICTLLINETKHFDDKDILTLFEKCHANFYGRSEYTQLRSRWMVFKTMYIYKDEKYPMDDIPVLKKRASSDRKDADDRGSMKKLNPALHANGLTRALEEKREVYITQLDFTVEPDVLQQIISKAGDIEAVKIPLKRNKDIKGRMNDGYAYATYKLQASAERAVTELDGFELCGRKMHVVLADPGKVHTKVRGRKPKQIKFNQSKSVVLFNVLSSHQEEIKHKIDDIGKVAKYEERPELQVIIAEFTSERDCGIAGLKLDGIQLEGGERIRLGSLADLRKMERK